MFQLITFQVLIVYIHRENRELYIVNIYPFINLDRVHLQRV